MEILQYEFMQRALIAGLIIGIICPFIGTFLVLRRLSFMADTLAHISLAGIAVGLTLGIQPIVTTITLSVCAALGIEKLRKEKKIFGESILVLVMAFGMATAVVLISLSKGFNIDIFSYLFGSILTISKLDILLIASIGLLVIVSLIVFYKQFFLLTFDEDTAKISGVPVNMLNLIFSLLVALTISISMKIVGILLVSSLMVIPVIISIQICRSFKELIFLSIGFSLLGVMGGLLLSYHFNLAAGGAIVLTLVCYFTIVYGYKKLSLFLIHKKISHQKETSNSI